MATFNRRVADYLVGKNFHECWHYSLCDWKKLSFWHIEEGDGVALQNHLTSDQTHLRPSLIPGLLNAVQYNLNQNNPVTRFFEVGRVFHVLKKNSEYTRVNLTEGEHYAVELLAVAFVIVDNRSILEWKSREAEDFYTAKSIVLQLAKFAQLKLNTQEFANTIYADCKNEKVWQSGHAAQMGDIGRDGFAIHMGHLHFDLCRAWYIEDTVIAGECLILPELLPECETITPFRHFSLFPSITKDIALIVERNKQVDSVRQDLKRLTDEAMKEIFQSDVISGQELLVDLESSKSSIPFQIESIHIFDVYEGEHIDSDQKSVTFSIVFRSDDRTLTDKEVSLVFDRIQEKIKAFYPVRDCVK